MRVGQGIPATGECGAEDGVFSVAGVRAIVAAARERGVDPRALLATIGLGPDDLENLDGWIDAEAERRLWEEASLRVGDPAFGLTVGESLVGSEVPEVLYHAARGSPTVGEALHRLARHFAIFHRRARVRLEIGGAEARLVKQADPARGRLSPHGAMAMMSTTVLRLGYLLGRPFPVREAWFAHPRPPALAPYVRIFGPAVHFDRPCDAVVFAREQLAWPLPSHAPGLLRVLDGHLERVAAPSVGDDFMDRVRAQIAGHLSDPALAAAQIARCVGVSTRTLQRRLHGAGSTFQGLLDEARRELALGLLADQRRSVGEIAPLLGFAELRAFYRAFKRWTGTTPGQLRARH